MRFLADESCDFGVVRALREAGHDVVAVAELSPRAEDEAVADLALREDRVLLTEDKDFGRLVFATTRTAGCVILIRFPGNARRLLGPTVVKAVARRIVAVLDLPARHHRQGPEPARRYRAV